MKTGIELIAEERQRQIDVEGWTLEHDDKYDMGELAAAAMCYLTHPDDRKEEFGDDPPIWWPWFAEWWKPTPNNRIRELQKAGALAAAEIDRLNRLK